MARKRTIRRSKKKKNRLSFLPEPLQAFLARRLVDIIAGILFLGGGFLLVALASYNHTDPSWNTASAQNTATDSSHNWAGESGAWISDLLVQTLGIGGFVLAFGLIFWGYRAFRREPVKSLWLRMIALMVSALCASVAFALVPSHGWTVHPYLGSSAGTLILQSFGQAGFLAAVAPPVISVSAGFIAVLAFFYAAAITRLESHALFQKARGISLMAAHFLYQTAQGFYGWVCHYNDPDYTPKKLEIFKAKPKATPRTAPRMTPQTPEPAAPAPPPAQKTAPTIPVVAPRNQDKNTAPQSQQHFTLSEEDWDMPALDLLQAAPDEGEAEGLDEESLRKNAELLQNVLSDFNIEGEIVSIHPGPVVTLYEFEPAPGIKTNRVISLSDDIARSMSAVSVRCAVVPGRNVIGIELPNKERQIVYMQELLASRLYEKTGAGLPLILGKDIGGQPILADLAKMPHLLVAGTTGSGKSVAVNTMILSLLFRLPPEKCRFIMIDPKMLELSVYDDIPHLLSPVVTEPGKAVVALKWTVNEMEERYRAMSKLGVRNIEGYNARIKEAAKKGESLMQKVQTGYDPDTGQAVYEDQEMELTELPYIVVVVDEFADLMLVAGKDVEAAVQRLAQMARAAGIHLIMATQRPSVDVITGVVKANFPTRISFQVTSKIDSRTILGEGGAEQLLGMGDMLYMAPGGKITRVHGPFVSDKDVRKVTDFLRAQGQPAYIEEVTDDGGFGGDSEIMGALFGDEGGGEDKVDELYDQAVALVAKEGKASTSFVQRYLQIGYNRAARIIEEMEKQGIISPATPTGKRDVLIRDFSDV